MTMMRIVVIHPENFTNPKLAFSIGFVLFIDMILLEVLNLI